MSFVKKRTGNFVLDFVISFVNSTGFIVLSFSCTCSLLIVGGMYGSSNINWGDNPGFDLFCIILCVLSSPLIITLIFVIPIRWLIDEYKDYKRC